MIHGQAYLRFIRHTSVAPLTKTLVVCCIWKYAKNGDFHADSPNRTDDGCKKTRSFFRSYILYSLAVFSRCTVPAWTLSNLIADGGKCTRATRGQSPPSMTALTRFVFVLLILRLGESGVDESAVNPMSNSEEKKSRRSEVIS